VLLVRALPRLGFGTMDFQATYQYWIMGDFQNPSDGDWEGGSQNDHPGFIWHPVHVKADPRLNPNPVVKYYDPYILKLLNDLKSVYISADGLNRTFHMRSPAIFNERRLIREERRVSAGNP
jgi:hypothetical protein